MQGILTNPWVVGIGASLISGLIVAILTRQIFARKTDREYLQRVSRANDEILSGVIPLIAEQKLPEPVLVESLIRSTGRKYGVPKDDLYTQQSLAEDVIKEIVSSSFLSTSQKTDFSAQVAGMIPKPTHRAKEGTSEMKRTSEAARERATTMMSFYMATMAAFASVLAFMTYAFTKTNSDTFSLTKVAFPIMAVTVAFATLLSALSMFARRFRLHALEFKAAGVKADFRSRPADEYGEHAAIEAEQKERDAQKQEEKKSD